MPASRADTELRRRERQARRERLEGQLDRALRAPAPARPAGEHCWHAVSGMVLSMYPPVYPVRCCWCGEKAGEQTWPTDEVIEGHGPHGPRRTRTVYHNLSVETCPGRPS